MCARDCAGTSEAATQAQPGPIEFVFIAAVLAQLNIRSGSVAGATETQAEDGRIVVGWHERDARDLTAVA
jgi:hypothetical protein